MENVIDPSKPGDETNYSITLGTDRFGKASSTCEMAAGSTSWIIFPNEILDGLIDFTISVWIRPTNLSQSKAFFSVFNPSASNHIVLNTGDVAFFNLDAQGYGPDTSFVFSEININVWY